LNSMSDSEIESMIKSALDESGIPCFEGSGPLDPSCLCPDFSGKCNNGEEKVQ